jgi:hypothetical protein
MAGTELPPCEPTGPTQVLKLLGTCLGLAWCRQIVMAEKTALTVSPVQGRWPGLGCLKLPGGREVGMDFKKSLAEDSRSRLWPSQACRLGLA